MTEISATTGAPRRLNVALSVAILAAKTSVSTETFGDIQGAAHATAFAVAGANIAEQAADFQKVIIRMQAEGGSLADFRKEFDRIVETYGWSYKGKRGWRSEVIYRTNMRQTAEAAKWLRQQEIINRSDEKGWMRQYSAVLDLRTRPHHRDWHGLTLLADDPFWETHLPPNGYNCRCTSFLISPRAFALQQKGRDRIAKLKAPKIIKELDTVRVGGGVVPIIKTQGIDVGFDYNPGIAAFGRNGNDFRALLGGDKFSRVPNTIFSRVPLKVLPLPVRRSKVVEAAVGRVVSARLIEKSLRRTLGGKSEKFVEDPLGGGVLFTTAGAAEALARQGKKGLRTAALLPQALDIVEKPEEIWATFYRSEETGKVFLRRQYVKRLRDDKGGAKTLRVWKDGGWWSGADLEDGEEAGRQGLRVYRKGFLP